MEKGIFFIMQEFFFFHGNLHTLSFKKGVLIEYEKKIYKLAAKYDFQCPFKYLPRFEDLIQGILNDILQGNR